MTKTDHPIGSAGYGTFNGVFLPTLLSVFGVVMFLRLGWMVGHVGLPTTLLVILLSFAVALMTALSISATVSNMRVGGGGAYFIISRSLGIEAGTAVGLLLYLAQSLGISFFLVGFAESVLAIFPQVGPNWVVSLPMLVLLSAIVFKSADFMVKLQIPIALAIFVGLIAFFIGNGSTVPLPAASSLSNQPESMVGFWAVFAVFFPAVTGIISGIGLSGQLRDPSKSLPRGMLAGLAVAAFMFLSIPVLLNFRVSSELLRNDTLIMAKIAFWQPLVVLALWAAALSSAIAAFLAAPRTLQALALDQALPKRLGRGFRSSDPEPRLAMALTVIIALFGIMLGDLNAIAPILSMIFLTAFVTLNFSAGIESIIKSPSWRPTFRVPAVISLGGALLALLVMLMIDAGSGIIALFVTAVVYYLMLRRQMRSHWGDARQGMMMLLARYAIQRLQEFPIDPHSWKPNFLVMTGSPSKQLDLIEFVEYLNQDSGFITVATIVPQDTDPERVRTMEMAIRSYLREQALISLTKVIPAETWAQGCMQMLQYYGLGQLAPDTLVIGIPSDAESIPELAEVLIAATKRRFNVVLLRLALAATGKKKKKQILVWWGGKQQDGSLMIAFGFLLHRSPNWGRSSLLINSMIAHENQRQDSERRLADFLSRSHIDASCQVIEMGTSSEPLDRMIPLSQEVDMVFMGIRDPGDYDYDADKYGGYLGELFTKTRSLANLALVMAADEVRLARLFR